MSDNPEQRLGFGFGLLGGVLIALGGIVSLATGIADLALGRPTGALTAGSQSILLFVVGGLALFFAWLGHREWSTRPLSSGILLVVVAAIGVAVVGLGSSLLGLIGAIFVFLAGILYALEPAKKAVSVAVTP